MAEAEKPKRRNAPRTKARILAAAQDAFAQRGYPQTGIRDIAAMADVSSTLLIRYFGSKMGLFEAALIEAMGFERLFERGRDRFGAHLAELLTDPSLDIKPPSIIALATGDADARQTTARVTQSHVVEPLGKWLGPPDGQLRAIEITMLAVSFVLFTRQVPLVPSAKASEKKLARWLAESVQAIVDRT